MSTVIAASQAHEFEYTDYHDAGFIVFPLYPIINGKCSCSRLNCRDAGKHPISQGWQNLPLMSDEQFEIVTGADGLSRNRLADGFGVLLSRTADALTKLLVIDTDPRNGGHESYARLIEAVPEITRAGCIVETGRRDGGKHLYFKIPADLDLVGSLPDYSGIDFKSSGFVCGAGSTHLAGNRYRFVTGSPSEITDAPAALIDLLKRKPKANKKGSKHKSHAPKKLQKIMHALPNDSSFDYEKFIRVGMALHHELNGHEDGFFLWLEWSEKSPVHDDGQMHKKWNSFDSKTDSAVTFGTLAHYCDEYSIDWREIIKEPLREFAEVLEDAQALDEDSDPADIEMLALESADLNPIERRKVWNAIKTQTGTPIGVLQQTINDASRVGEDDHLVHARSVIHHIGRDNVLSALSYVWQWDDAGVWRKCEERTVRSWAQDTLSGREEVTKGLIDSVTDLIKTEVFQPNHQFDIGGDECVNTLNGEVSLIDDSWVLQPHERQHYRTTQIPVDYIPTATAPRFSQFLREVFPNADGQQQAQALLEMMGYSLMAHCKHEKFIILVGNGANGKSVVLKVLEQLCGAESVAGVQPSQFANKFQRAHLLNKLVNIVSEIEQGAVIDDAALKGITSGETTTVEQKFKDPFQITPFATCWFGTNHMPHTRDFTDGLFRRAVILKFDAVFKPELGNCDPFLLDKLKAELSGILSMALNAYSDALMLGFTTPASSVQALDEWRLEADQVAQFIGDDCTTDKSAEIQATDLYSAYKSWASDNGVQRALSMKSFRDRLTRLGCGQRRTSSARYVTGIELRAGVNRATSWAADY